LRRSRLEDYPDYGTGAGAIGRRGSEVLVTKKRRKRSNSPTALPVMRPNAAGIDIGATEIYVAVPADRAPKNVRAFATFTQDLQALADWLQQCGVDTVAMESTGVYWIPLFQILEDRGLEVCLVNARHVKNVPGRKSDVSDCQWLQFLHSVGLLRASFRPEPEICAVRAFLRHRESLRQMACTHVLHMQKALDQMNLQLHHVISDITGQTGLAIVDAILGGERDARRLAKLRNGHIQASEAVIVKSLVGDYREEHLFTLRQSLEAYRQYQRFIEECEGQIRRAVERFEPPPPPTDGPAPGDPPAPSRRSSPLDSPAEAPSGPRQQLERAFGVDLTQIPSIKLGTVQTLFGEVGPDFRPFRSASAFASWMGLCPHNDISGGKVLHAGTRKVNCRIATILRVAAQSLYRSKSALGDYYRRMRARLGGPKALTATAHKLARIIYHLVTTGQPFDESRFAADQTRYQQRQQAKLRAKARALGFQLVPVQEAI